MKSLEELHNAYIKSRDLEDNFNFDDDNEIRKINEYYNTDNEVVELTHWQPVARDVEFKKQVAKLKAMQKFNHNR